MSTAWVKAGPGRPEEPGGPLNPRGARKALPPTSPSPSQLRLVPNMLRKPVRLAVTQLQAAHGAWGSPGLRIMLGEVGGTALLSLTALLKCPHQPEWSRRHSRVGGSTKRFLWVRWHDEGVQSMVLKPAALCLNHADQTTPPTRGSLSVANRNEGHLSK